MKVYVNATDGSHGDVDDLLVVDLSKFGDTYSQGLVLKMIDEYTDEEMITFGRNYGNKVTRGLLDRANGRHRAW